MDRFNRNIVECKVHLIDDDGNAGQVLIETLWNVKVKIAGDTFPKYKF